MHGPLGRYPGARVTSDCELTSVTSVTTKLKHSGVQAALPAAESPVSTPHVTLQFLLRAEHFLPQLPSLTLFMLP